MAGSLMLALPAIGFFLLVHRFFFRDRGSRA
jgi:hypothetical protein